MNINDVYAYVTTSDRSLTIVKFSAAFQHKMSQLAAKGYLPYKASIRHIVYWRYEDIDEGTTKFVEIPIVLPEILFKRK